MSDDEISLDRFDAIIFDLDGVVTRTASVHAAAWKRLFDAYLRQRPAREGEDHRPFDIGSDYPRHLDGRPRYDGVRNFLHSRGIEIPWGAPQDSPDRETVHGLGNRKNGYFQEALQTDGVEVYDTTIAFIREVRSRGIGTAIISASRNCRKVLKAAGIEDLFDARVDGEIADELNLPGKPAADVFLEAARRLGSDPKRSVVLEDALAGVQAGAAGGFGLVIGIDRIGQAQELRRRGADIVVHDLAELTLV